MSKARMIEAVENLDVESVKKLLNADPSLLSTTDRQGLNLLHLACSVSCEKLKFPESASARMVNFLLDQGLGIDEPVGRDACTPLFFAVARARNPTLVKLLLKRGAKVTAAPGCGTLCCRLVGRHQKSRPPDPRRSTNRYRRRRHTKRHGNGTNDS